MFSHRSTNRSCPQRRVCLERHESSPARESRSRVPPRWRGGPEARAHPRIKTKRAFPISVNMTLLFSAPLANPARECLLGGEEARKRRRTSVLGWAPIDLIAFFCGSCMFSHMKAGSVPPAAAGDGRSIRRIDAPAKQSCMHATAPPLPARPLMHQRKAMSCSTELWAPLHADDVFIGENQVRLQPKRIG